MTFFEHLRELGRLLLISLIAVALGAAVAQYYHEPLIAFLLKPLNHKSLLFLSPLAPLFFIVKIDVFVGVFLALPVLSWSLLSFVKPAMKASNWFLFSLLYLIAAVSMTTGLAYAYFVVLPRTLEFLLSIKVSGIDNMITANSYLTLLLMEGIAIAVLFQIPLFIFAGIHIKAFDLRTIAAKRRIIYLGGLIALSFISPPDLLSFGMLAIPACLFFEGSLVALWGVQRLNGIGGTCLR